MHRIKAISQITMVIGIALPLFSYAAPQLILSWKANSYVPAGYTGKALPVAGTKISASAILLDGGKVISLTPYNIHWYAGENLIATGKGRVTAEAVAPATGEDTLELRVNIAKYASGSLDAFVTIPVVHPELPITTNGLTSAKPKGFATKPYFWNIASPADLAIIWEDNGDTVTARASNKANALEFAQTTISKQ